MNATVIRVGNYSAECKTREAIETLYKQFNKFIEPAVPQQEEKLQQIMDLARQLYGEETSGYVLWGQNAVTWGGSKQTLRLDHLRRKSGEFKKISVILKY